MCSPLSVPSLSFECSSCSDSFSMFDDTCEILQTMMTQELTRYCITPESISTKRNPWRRVMIDWMNKIVDVFGMSDNIVQVAIYYLDTSVAKELVRSSQDYRVAALTSLHLAIKVYDSKLFPIHQFLSASHTTITSGQVSDMEQRMLSALEWKLHPPTYDCFVRQYCMILRTCTDTSLDSTVLERVEREALRLSRIIMIQECLRPYRQSVVAYAVMIRTLNSFLQEEDAKNIDDFKRAIIRSTRVTDVAKSFVDHVSEFVSHMEVERKETKCIVDSESDSKWTNVARTTETCSNVEVSDSPTRSPRLHNSSTSLSPSSVFLRHSDSCGAWLAYF